MAEKDSKGSSKNKEGFHELFKPIKIGDCEIKNRIALAPMNMAYSTQDGYVTNQDIAHLARRAKGGFGLIITGAVIATRLSAPFVWQRNLLFHSDSFIPGMNTLVDACHNFEAKVFCQLSIGFGRGGHSIDGSRPYAPSPIPEYRTIETTPKIMFEGFKRIMAAHPGAMIETPGFPGELQTGDVPREMTIDEIKSEQIEFAKACQRCVVSGFDGIEIHAPHGYLEHQFLSPRSNKRTDMYGGSLENRMRFVLEVTERALNAVKGTIPLGIRLSADEHLPGGFTLDEVKEVVKRLSTLGISFLHLSDGAHENERGLFPESMEWVEKHGLTEAKELKACTGAPIITPSIHDPERAERAVKEKTTDMISLGRQALSDPEWPNKVKDGKIGEIVRCRRDLQCLGRSFGTGLSARCILNRELGFEQFDPDLFPRRMPGELMPPGVKKMYGV
jgi:2,4-dienoyl-CoA reductase-like NADH-dependent reductase (Old Yellow Enzyme family)